MNLQAFNQLNASDASDLLRQCVHIESWVSTLVSHRPFQSFEQLDELATQLASHWTWAEVESSLAQHPRIGEKKASIALTPKEQAHSNSEQGQMQFDDELSQQLYQGNLDYENQFGHIFLIRAKGRTAEETLNELHRRLDNDAETERVEVSQQLAEIALLRLHQEVTA